MPEYYSFAFRGLLTDQALDRAGRKQRAIFSDTTDAETAQRLSIPLLDADLVARARKMATVYTAICAFENSVRAFVEKKLLEEKGHAWWGTSVPEKIRTRAESRKTEEDQVRWHTPRGDALINYTEFGDLISIMQMPGNWNYFEPHIGTIEWARNIIQTLERSRNVIMHSGDLHARDVERIGTCIRDWIQQVG